jgi:hypothetical protein
VNYVHVLARLYVFDMNEALQNGKNSYNLEHSYGERYIKVLTSPRYSIPVKLTKARGEY